MPRIRQNAAEYRTEDFRKAIEHCRVDVGAKHVKSIAEDVDIPCTTLWKRLRTPDDFTFAEFRKFLKAVPVPMDAVLVFLGYPKKEIKKTEETQ